ncbi:protein ACCELERATED CELL DEATH 6-like [Telopea speciosissima]|uniref:protein ACCELERATED CELL DEATH 6-like n=1 Tax=Telopea speciosissima TaxID=54955 RepID=UPI001CC731DA|nr:protein ACCELERATED CELL DEATH 6-like [Telopea speciosissima]
MDSAALYKAVTEGDHSALRLEFLKASENDRVQQQSDQNKNTLLHIAANSNNVQVVEVIRKNQPKTILRSKNYREDTPLHIAARNNNVDVVKCMLRWGKETDKAEKRAKRYETGKLKNRDGNTALHEAVLRRHCEVIEVLMEWDKEVIFMKNNSEESPLYLAADRGLHVVLEKMMKFATEVDNSQKKKDLSIYVGPDGRTPLHAAISNKHKLCVNILLDKKKDLISKADEDGRIPLHYAASFGHSEEAGCLLQNQDASSSIAHQKDHQGVYAIHMAAIEGHTGIIKAILECCPAAIETLNKDHQNVVHLAAKNGRADLVSYMMLPQKKKTNKFDKLKNAKDIEGNTPLHLATKNSHPKVVSILIRDGKVDMTIMNDEGLTARDIAEKEQMNEISLPKVLSLTALRINNAPSGRRSPIIEENASIEEDNTSKDVPETETNKTKSKERFNTLAVVPTLIMTVTFAAVFTVPGGFNADGPYKGMATLLRKPAFKVFVICNTMALYLSIIVVVNNIWAQWGDNRLLNLAVDLSSPLLGIALILMAIAFAAGLYSVILKLQWLAFLVLVIGAIFLLYIIILLLLFNVLHMSKYRVLRRICKLGFYLLIFTFDRFMTKRTVDH